ncbi:hypothetical protein PVAG01_07137 [Phlyctema vagabunda]|uniref:DUF7587 domain-containing protein n=1 Tax=Phlyctema vagabunda TaxID=108571 RepID=A0ABR4PBL0_9HELO
MAPLGIADELQALSLLDSEYLLFNPRGDKAWLQEKFDDIPRYLFRVFTPKSCGKTDGSWTKSMDARRVTEKGRVDIFTREDNEQVASMLNAHLRWWEGTEDNLVSWTSSLLFALVYIFHLHANCKDGSAFDDIFICIIDTTMFPKGVFLRDMDLIQAYISFDAALKNFEGLRSKKGWYFGEYLSQGALKIEGKCQIVSAQAMIDEDLYDLRRKFEEFSLWERRPKPPWAQPVVDLRNDLYQVESPKTGKEKSFKEKLQAAINIAHLFGPGWSFPVAINLTALLPLPKEDTAIIQAFRANRFTDDDRANCSPLKTKVIAYNGLPEVKQLSDIMRSVYTDFCVTKLTSCVEEAEAHLRLAIIFGLNQSLECQDSALLSSVYNAVKGRLDMETCVSQQLREMIGSSSKA